MSGRGPLVAVVLAAGAATRMGGRPKAFLRLDPRGPTFVEAIAHTCGAAGVDRVVVVLRPGVAGPLPAAAAVVRNPRPDDGMLSSLQTALRAPDLAGAGAALIWPVDCPRVPAAVVRRLVEAWRGQAGARIAVPSFARRRGHPALFDATLFEELLAAPPAQGARAVLRAHPEAIAHVEVDEPTVLDDLDTLADLEAVRAQLREG